MRRWLVNQRGFTLAELLVAVAVMGLVMAGVFVVQRGGQQAYLLGSSRVETQQNARVALDLMTRELRSATSVVTLGSATDLTFTVCGDPPPISVPCVTPSTMRYALSGTTLNRTVDGAVTALIGGVESLAMTYCLYDVARDRYTTTTDPDRLELVKIEITTKTENNAAPGSPGDQHAVMKSTVKLRRDAKPQPVPLAPDCAAL